MRRAVWLASPGSRQQRSWAGMRARQVRVRDAEGEVPLYVLCRRWVQNNPNLDERAVLAEAAARQPPQAAPLPPPLPPSAELLDAEAASLPALPLLPVQRGPPSLDVRQS